MLFRILLQPYEPHRQGEGHHDAHIQGIHGDKVDDLTHRGHHRQRAKIPLHASGVATALGDHKSIDGKGQAADDPQPCDLGQ